MNKQKSLVYTLIFLLTFTGTLSLFTPAQAETWTDITLPYTITQGGSYRISGAFYGSGTALSINASNVVVDGQNNLISLNQSEGDTAISILPNSRNVLLRNLNQTGADYGVYAMEGNFTVTDSLFTNNNSTGIFAFNTTAFTIRNSRSSDSAYGVVAVDCSNVTVDDCHIKGNTKGVVAVLSSGVTVQSSYFDSNGEAADFLNCTNVSLDSSMFVENKLAVNATYTVLSANNISASNNTDYSIHLIYSNFSAVNSQFENNMIGVYALYSNFTCTFTSLSNNLLAGLFSGACNATLIDCAIENNRMYGALFIENNATMINDCGIKNNEYGLGALASQTLIVKNSLIYNNTHAGLLDQECTSTISCNNFTLNGVSNDSQEYGGGALFQIESNSTVTDNIFKNNYEALLIGGWNEEVASILNYNYNTFENNNYTFDFNYELPSNDTNLQIYFYNNYVNDTAYLSPLSIINEGMGTPTANVLFLNTTLQAGNRVTLDGGRMIGGNYWANPNGTGFSQTALDANQDGFTDAPFDLFGNQTVYDYLPYSTSFKENVTKLTISPAYASVKVGQALNYTATATDQYGNTWNVTADYTVNDSPFNGTLYIAYPGLYYIRASYGGQTADAQLSVTPGDVDHYRILTPTNVTAGSPFAIRIVALDAYSNIANQYSGTVTLSTSSGTINPSTSGAFSYGTWIGNITVADAETFTITAIDGNANTGTSSTVNVTQETTQPTTTPTPTPTPTSTTQPTANPTNSSGTSDNYWWAWYAIPTLALLALAAAGVYFIKRPKKSLTQ